MCRFNTGSSLEFGEFLCLSDSFVNAKWLKWSGIRTGLKNSEKAANFQRKTGFCSLKAKYEDVKR